MSDDDKPRKGFLRTLLTEDDANKVWDSIRVLGFAAMGGHLSLAGYSVVYLGRPLSLSEFGIGAASIIAATGGGLYAKKQADA